MKCDLYSLEQCQGIPLVGFDNVGLLEDVNVAEMNHSQGDLLIKGRTKLNLSNPEGKTTEKLGLCFHRSATGGQSGQDKWLRLVP